MLSSQQRLALRVARRRLPSTNALLFGQSQTGSLAAFSTFPSYPSNNRRNDQSTSLAGLPVIQLQGRNGLLSTTVLERAYPLGVGNHSPIMLFSTTAKDKPSYRERAHEYGDKAKQGAQSFGGMMKRYGPYFVGTYLSVYVANLGLFYAGIQSGALDPVTMLGYITGNHEEVRNSAEVVSELLEHYTVTAPFAEVVREKPHLANFAIAWISTKFTEPIRFGLSVAIVPRVARFFGIAPNIEEEEKDEGETENDGEKKTEEEAKTEEETKTEEKKP